VHISWLSIQKGVSKKEALQVLELIMDNIHTCCAVTMEPDEVLVLCDKLKAYIEND
jgi:hypothetical protein